MLILWGESLGHDVPLHRFRITGDWGKRVTLKAWSETCDASKFRDVSQPGSI